MKHGDAHASARHRPEPRAHVANRCPPCTLHLENETTKERCLLGAPHRALAHHPPGGPVTAAGSPTHRPWDACRSRDAFLRQLPSKTPGNQNPPFHFAGPSLTSPSRAGLRHRRWQGGRREGAGPDPRPQASNTGLQHGRARVTATHRTGCRGSLAGPSGACSCRGRPEMEAVGRPEVLPLE